MNYLLIIQNEKYWLKAKQDLFEWALKANETDQECLAMGFGYIIEKYSLPGDSLIPDDLVALFPEAVLFVPGKN